MDLMSIEEMRQHKWRVAWSGGKDSTATIILMHENGIPIDKIVYVRMMFNDTLPATLPVMTNFVDHAAEVFRSWGYTVDIVKSQKTAFELTEKVMRKSKYSENNGNKYGVSPFMRGHCQFMNEKPKAINSIGTAEYEMIGYAADEVDRTHRLGGGRQSILLALNVKEIDTFRICSKYDLLSPLYKTGVGRDGCFFCPNAGERERERDASQRTSRTRQTNIRDHWKDEHD